MEESKLEEIVSDKMGEYGIIKSKSIMSHLMNVEQYFIRCEEDLEKSITQINNINITVRGISKATGIGKSTIYNNPTTLKLYIEKRKEQIQKKDIFSVKRTEKLEETINALKDILEKTKVNIVNHHLLEGQVESLKRENEQLEKKVGYLSEERIKMVSQINDLEKQLQAFKRKNANVVNIYNENEN